MVCGPSFVCTSGSCSVDPASRWNVVLESLTVPMDDYTGATWDPLGGLPDPFVEIRVGSDTTPSTSGVANDTLTTTYDGGPTATNVRADALRAVLDFEVWDQDTSSNNLIGRCQYTDLPEGPFSGGSQTLTCPVDASTMNSGFTLNWHLERF